MQQGGWGGGPPGPPGAPPGYGPPQQQGGYGAPQPQPQGAPSQQGAYGPPPQPQGGYGPPPQAQGGYGAPPQPQGGYGAPPQPGYGAPPGAMAAAGGGGTLMGVPLEPGERVVWFRQHSYTGEKVMLWIFGVLFLIVLIGIIFIVLALTLDGRKPKAHAITNRRIIVFPGKGGSESHPLGYVADLEPVRQQATNAGGGLLGAAIGAAVTAVANSMANQNAKTAPGYWARTIGVWLIMQNGQRIKVDVEPSVGQNFGVTLAQVVFQRAGDMMPPVPHPA